MTPKALSRTREEIVEALKPLRVGSMVANKGSDAEMVIIEVLLDIRDLLTKENK